MAIDLKAFYSKILSGAQAVNSAVNSVNPYNKLVQSAGKAISQVPAAIQAFNPKNNVGGYLAQTIQPQNLKTNISDYWSGKRNLNEEYDFIANEAQRIKNPVLRTAANIGIMETRKGPSTFQNIAGTFGPNRSPLERGLSGIGLAWNALQLTPTPAAALMTRKWDYGVPAFNQLLKNINMGYKGDKDAMSRIADLTGGIAKETRLSQAVGMENSSWAPLVDIGEYVLLGGLEASTEKAISLNKALKLTLEGKLDEAAVILSKYKEFSGMESVSNLKSKLDLERKLASLSKREEQAIKSGDKVAEWKVLFERARVLFGDKSKEYKSNLSDSIKTGDVRSLEKSLNQTRFKNLSIVEKKAILEEAQRMLAGNLGDVGFIKNIDEVTGRYTSNPQWYKDFFKANKKAPSNSEFFEIANSRINK
jgi:hypothetical protein